MERFTFGLLTGMVGAALFVANSQKVRSLVKKGQEEVEEFAKEKMEEIKDEPKKKSKKKNNA